VESGFDYRQGQESFSSVQRPYRCTGTLNVLPTAWWALSSGSKEAEREAAYHAPPTNAELKIRGAAPPFLPMCHGIVLK
jgi:hypothetical protein